MLSPAIETTCTGTFGPSVKLLAHLLVSCGASRVQVPTTVSLVNGIVFPCHLPSTCAIEIAAGAAAVFEGLEAAADVAPAGAAATVAESVRLWDRPHASVINAHAHAATRAR